MDIRNKSSLQYSGYSKYIILDINGYYFTLILSIYGKLVHTGKWRKYEKK